MKKLSKAGVKLLSPAFLEEEIKEHWKEIKLKSKLHEDSLKLILSSILELVECKPKSEYEDFLEDAGKICSDKNDIPYVALVLAFKAPVWTFDRQLASDCEKVGIKVFRSVQEVIKGFKLL